MRSIYDPVFATMPSWQAPMASSPFRVRGVIYQRDVARIESTVHGGLAAVLTASGNPDLGAFYKQSFSSHRFYDTRPNAIAGHVAARLRGITLHHYLREAAKDYAQATLQGLTGLVVQRIPLTMIAQWLPKAAQWFNDFGTVETCVAGPRLVRATRTMLPPFMVLGWAISAIEFTEAVFRHCGAKEVRTYPLSVESDGQLEGLPLHRVSFEVAWSE